MSVFETVRELSSFRKTQDETISRQVLGKILEAARWTPSPGNVQGLEFVVVESGEELERLASSTDDRIAEAAAAVLVVGDVDRLRKRFGDDAETFCAAEAGAASQNMRLVAKEEGLSSLWITGFEAGEEFGVPPERKVFGVAAFGYTEDPVPLDPKFGLSNVVYYERYGNRVSSIFDSAGWKGAGTEFKALERKSKKILDRLRRKAEQFL
ncbi:MAG: nitroreductase family protein [Candidatus Nanohaloarchaea archaeon]